MIRLAATLLLLLSRFWYVTPSAAADTRIRIVFFTPSGVEPPAGVRERMKEVVDYGQAFYGRWLKH